MIRFSEFLRPDRIKLSIDATRKKEAIKEVAGILNGAEEIIDRERFIKEVFQREGVESTGIGNGVAVPHARTDAIEKLVVALGRSDTGVDFGAVDGKPVRLIFVMGTPSTGVTNYLKILAQLSRLVRSHGCIDKLLAAETPEEIIDTFKNLEEC